MSDSDDDNIVRYGTQLEPFEEDRTSAMPKTNTKLNRSEKRKLRKLLAANVNVNKAREVCHLSWPEICQIIPGIEHNAPETSVNPPKKMNKNHPKVRVRPTERLKRLSRDPERLSREPERLSREPKRLSRESERLSREPEPNQTSVWHNPYRDRVARRTSQDRGASPNYWRPVRRNTPSPLPFEYEANQEPYLRQPYRSPQTYTEEVLHTTPPNFWEEAGPSHERAYDTNRRRRSPSLGDPNWEPTYRDTKDSQVAFGEPNYWERDGSPPRSRHDTTPINCRSNNSYERTQPKYSDTDALQVKVQDGMRAVNRHYNDMSDVKPFSDQPYRAQHTSSEGAASLNCWPEPDRPSRLGLRNETHPPKRAHTYSYSEDKKFKVSKYQKNSWGSSVNLDRESARPLPGGLRNETQTMPTICIDDDSNVDYRGRTYKPRTPVDECRGHFDFSEPARRETNSEIGSQSRWHQPSENRVTFEDSDANGNIDGEPIRVAIHNVTPMSSIQMTLVHQCINLAIARIGVQDAGPKFSGSTYKTGWILMNCENHMSRKWLEEKIPALKPWPEANLSVTPPPDEFTKPITLTILIPNSEGVTALTALELLRIQNPGLDTEKWKVLTVTKTSKYQILLLSVDEGSFKALRLLNFKANLGINKVSFWVKSGPSERGDYVNLSVGNIPLASSSAYTERDKNSVPYAAENTTTKISRKRRRTHKNNRITHSQAIDCKPSLLGRPVLLPNGPSLLGHPVLSPNRPNLPQANSAERRPLLDSNVPLVSPIRTVANMPKKRWYPCSSNWTTW